MGFGWRPLKFGKLVKAYLPDSRILAMVVAVLTMRPRMVRAWVMVMAFSSSGRVEDWVKTDCAAWVVFAEVWQACHVMGFSGVKKPHGVNGAVWFWEADSGDLSPLQYSCDVLCLTTLAWQLTSRDHSMMVTASDGRVRLCLVWGRFPTGFGR